MNVKNAGIISLLAAGFAVGSSQFLPANAYGVTNNKTITLNAGDIGRQIDPITWLVPSGTGTLTQDLSARAIVKVLDFKADFVDLSFNISNTTSANFNAALVSFGIGVEENVSSVRLTKQGRVFDSATLLAENKTFPGGFKGIDFCTFAANNCSGGDIKDGLQKGASDSFTLRISSKTGSFASGITLASYPVKFQSDYGSHEVAGVPEPITIVGSGLALGFGTLLKKEANKKRNKQKVKA